MTSYEETGIWKKNLAIQEENDPYINIRERLRSAYISFRERAKILSSEISRSLPNYTVHDINHLDALWELADIILGKDYSLTPIEVFTLGGAILIHDLGLALASLSGGIDDLKKEQYWNDIIVFLFKKKYNRLPNKNELDKLEEDIKDQAVEIVLRHLHAKNVENLATYGWIDKKTKTKYYLIEDSELREKYGPIIGKIAHSHWWSLENLKKNFQAILGPIPSFPNDWIINPLKISLILRAADICHLDSRRSPKFLKIIRKIEGKSLNHWTFQEKLNKPIIKEDRLLFTSGIEFSIDESMVWWLCYDALQIADNELRSINNLLINLGYPKFAAEGIIGIEDPEHLVKYIPTKAWVPIDTRIKISDVASLIKKLGGNQLYGRNIDIPLRELIQNSLDAINARRLLEIRPENWGKIIIKTGKDAEGYWIEIEDNGVGMSVDVLKGSLLDFGKSFWESELLFSEFPGLSSKLFNPIGKYGIGFFSVFMWSKKIYITTRRYDDAQINTHILEFNDGFNLRPILRKARKGEYLNEGGTRVRIWVKKSKIDDIEKRCLHICPSIDVNLFLKINNKSEKIVIRGSDWIDLKPEKFLKRIISKEIEKIPEPLLKELIKN